MNAVYYLLHVEEIAVGMLIESLLSYHKNMLNEMEVDEIFRNILKIFPKVRITEKTIPKLIDKMKLDKKNQKSQINFSLINGLGQSTFDVFIDKIGRASCRERVYNTERDRDEKRKENE